jgi:hypothetical protein
VLFVDLLALVAALPVALLVGVALEGEDPVDAESA